jgi:hypothetical protein
MVPAPAPTSGGVQGLHDPALPEHMKEEMAQGLFAPVQHGASGQYEMSRDTIERQAQALLQADVQYHLSRMLGNLRHSRSASRHRTWPRSCHATLVKLLALMVRTSCSSSDTSAIPPALSVVAPYESTATTMPAMDSSAAATTAAS